MYKDSEGKDKPRTVTDGGISAIVQNMEKMISFSWGQFRFVDSYAFLSSSLDKLVTNTPKECLTITRQRFPASQVDLMTRKGAYPYEYMNDFARFEETELPSQVGNQVPMHCNLLLYLFGLHNLTSNALYLEKLSKTCLNYPVGSESVFLFVCEQANFYSSLSQEGITDDDYLHAQQVWGTFNCATLGDYHDLYLRTDVHLLADVFENFRKAAMATYKLDPAHYYTLHGYSWDALLKSTGVSLELLSDPDMYLFIEKGLRGGISMVSHRHAIANTPQMQNYNPEKPTSYLMYLDANNLSPRSRPCTN